jgi:hypothetical protein
MEFEKGLSPPSPKEDFAQYFSMYLAMGMLWASGYTCVQLARNYHDTANANIYTG